MFFCFVPLSLIFFLLLVCIISLIHKIGHLFKSGLLYYIVVDTTNQNY